MTRTSPARNTGLLQRVLGLVTEVHPGEIATSLLLTLNVFVLLTAYYVIKPVREGLILELQSGAEYKSYMSGAIAIALLFLVPAYSRFAGRVPRNKLVVSVTLFFVSHLVLFYIGSSVDVIRQNLGLVFYLWVGIFNMMLVAQFWAFANDVYSEEQGKRLFPLVGLGASLGAAVGSKVTDLLVQPLGRYQLLLVSACLLSTCALLFHLIHLREHREAGEPSAVPPASRGDAKAARPGASGAFTLVLNNRYLRLLAAFSLLFTLVNTNGEYMLGKLFKQVATEHIEAGSLAPGQLGDYLTAQYASFFFYVNVIGVLLQTFVVSRLVKYTGLRGAFFVLPVIALAGSVGFALFPVLAILRTSKIAENSTDYSVNNTVRNMLWLPTTREMKYKAKQAVDTFFVRMGDVGSSVCVAVLAGVLQLRVERFALVNVAFILVWLVLAGAIIRENERLHQLRVAPPEAS